MFLDDMLNNVPKYASHLAEIVKPAAQKMGYYATEPIIGLFPARFSIPTLDYLQERVGITPGSNTAARRLVTSVSLESAIVTGIVLPKAISSGAFDFDDPEKIFPTPQVEFASFLTVPSNGEGYGLDSLLILATCILGDAAYRLVRNVDWGSFMKGHLQVRLGGSTFLELPLTVYDFASTRISAYRNRRTTSKTN